MFEFLKSKRAVALSALLLFEAVFYIAYPKQEFGVLAKPLTELPTQFGSWSMVSETRIEPEVQEVLKADDTLNRVYSDSVTGASVSLFIAFFKTQSTGVAPHSPKVCLPGAGWEPGPTTFASIEVPGRAEPVVANHSVIARGPERSLVLYWYQTHDRVIADEYRAKLNTIFDSLRYHRSDTSIVRVVVPERADRPQDAESIGRRFVQSSFASIRAVLPQ
jgi:EpsI family protein